MSSRKNYIFTSESVSEGHPDKVCDRISDSIVDLYLSKEPESRIALETLATTNRVVLAGEVRGPEGLGHDELIETARHAVKDIGYEQEGFDWRKLRVECLVHAQSADIAMGVDALGNKDEGAGDQGIMFGYACRETDEFMPAPIFYSHRILKAMSDARKSGKAKELLPDAKSQVTLQYENGKPVRATKIVVSTQHIDGLEQGDIRGIVKPYIEKTMPAGWMCPDDGLYINPTGRFVIGGPDGDTGLTGRKIIVDTYGGAAPHGGGAFSGKDPTKVDRSAAYAARYLAKNVVAAGLAERCTIQIAYAIGVADPMSFYVDLHDTGLVDPAKLEDILPQMVSLKPRGIREHLGLNKPIYARTSAYGHFGRAPEADGGFSWEKTDLAPALKRHFH